jgi:ABC-type nickel/cobalt efflux system permease component RcnA
MLFITAITVGLVHTLIGPDHYVPFIVIGRARRWGWGRLMLLTFACGLGHVLSSVVIGLVGVALGESLTRVQGVEEARGEWAGWALILFGLGYGFWGLWRAMRKKHGAHVHLHLDGTIHRHGHEHATQGEHSPVHEHAHSVTHPEPSEPAPWKSLTPWVLFVIFVLGPCEPLIPLFFASALSGSWHEVLLVTVGYSAATLFAMHALVSAFWLGLQKVSLGPLERFSHALAGCVVLLSGVGMVFFGL